MAVCRWGFCGAGLICHDFAAAVVAVNQTKTTSDRDDPNASSPQPHHSLQSVAARDLERAEEFASRFGFAKAFGCYEEVAKDETVNVVYIGVVHSHHYQLAKMMILAGKHVLCEKPLTLHLHQTEELFQLAKSQNVFFMEGIWSRCSPVYRQISQEIQKGTIGEIIGVTVEFGQPINHRERVKNKAIGGGGLMDIGIYVIQFALLAFQRSLPSSVVDASDTSGESSDAVLVSAAGTKMESGADETGSIMLQFGEGKFAHLIYSCKVQLKNNAVIHGTLGRIEIPDVFWSPTQVLVNGKLTDFPFPKSLFKLNFPNSEGFVFEVDEVRRCLEQNLSESPLLTHRESILIHQIIHRSLAQLGVAYD